jgi:membrane associated rhomboid family serine protease
VLAPRDAPARPPLPLVTAALIALNVALFAYQASLPADEARLQTFRFGVVPYLLARDFHVDSVVTPFTSIFLHEGLIHLGFNMAFLGFFGADVERALGRVRFALFYLAAGLCAALAHVLVEPDSRAPMVGASGAIAGILGAYLRLYPQAGVVFFIAVWFLLQLLHGLGTLGIEQPPGGVAFFAHIGGFVAGLWLLRPFGVRRNPTSGFSRGTQHEHGER